jgi:hypothetical protein
VDSASVRGARSGEDSGLLAMARKRYSMSQSSTSVTILFSSAPLGGSHALGDGLVAGVGETVLR